jgi:hypothetical protein
MTEVQKNPKIVGVKSTDFKVMTADGAYTWFGEGGGMILFFYDTLEPEIKEDGSVDVKLVKRTFPIEIRLNPALYKDVISWMSSQVKAFEDSQKPKKSEKK